MVNESAAEEAILLMAHCKNPNHCSRKTRDEDETTVRHAKHGRRLKEKAEMKGMKRGWRELKMAEDRDENNGKDDGCIAGGSGVWSVECGVCGVWSVECGVWSV